MLFFVPTKIFVSCIKRKKTVEDWIWIWDPKIWRWLLKWLRHSVPCMLKEIMKNYDEKKISEQTFLDALNFYLDEHKSKENSFTIYKAQI